MSRRARLWHVARESKTALAYSGPEDDDDKGGIDAEPCPQCDGDGMDPMTDYVLPCPECGGDYQ